jgi:hypothetical protein
VSLRCGHVLILVRLAVLVRASPYCVCLGWWIMQPEPILALVFLRVDADAKSVFLRADKFDAGCF